MFVSHENQTKYIHSLKDSPNLCYSDTFGWKIWSMLVFCFSIQPTYLQCHWWKTSFNRYFKKNKTLLILTFTMASLVWAMSEMTPSVIMSRTKYWEPSSTAAAYLQWRNQSKGWITGVDGTPSEYVVKGFSEKHLQYWNIMSLYFHSLTSFYLLNKCRIELGKSCSL